MALLERELSSTKTILSTYVMEASSGETEGSGDSSLATQRVAELEQILTEYKRACDNLQAKLDTVSRASGGAGGMRGDLQMEDAEMAIREDRSNQNQVESGTSPFGILFLDGRR